MAYRHSRARGNPEGVWGMTYPGKVNFEKTLLPTGRSMEGRKASVYACEWYPLATVRHTNAERARFNADPLHSPDPHRQPRRHHPASAESPGRSGPDRRRRHPRNPKAPCPIRDTNPAHPIPQAQPVQKLPELLDRLSTEDIALVSDAGTPTINDPGRELIAAAAENGFEVVALPGASAVTTALAVSGIPTREFIFLGFLPRRRAERIELLSDLHRERRTLVAFETPHRLAASLSDLLETLGDRQIAVCRELTKLHEEVFRGAVSEAIDHFVQPRGELTLVVEGAPKGAETVPDTEAVSLLLKAKSQGMSARDAVSLVSEANRQIQTRSLHPLALPRRIECSAVTMSANKMLTHWKERNQSPQGESEGDQEICPNLNPGRSCRPRRRTRRSIPAIAADPDTFELDDEWFARARPAIEVDADLVENSARQQDKRKADAKEHVTISLDTDVLARFRESGPGWEDRLNETLRRAVLGA